MAKTVKSGVGKQKSTLESKQSKSGKVAATAIEKPVRRSRKVVVGRGVDEERVGHSARRRAVKTVSVPEEEPVTLADTLVASKRGRGVQQVEPSEDADLELMEVSEEEAVYTPEDEVAAELGAYKDSENVGGVLYDEAQHQGVLKTVPNHVGTIEDEEALGDEGEAALGGLRSGSGLRAVFTQSEEEATKQRALEDLDALEDREECRERVKQLVALAERQSRVLSVKQVNEMLPKEVIHDTEIDLFLNILSAMSIKVVAEEDFEDHSDVSSPNGAGGASDA